MKRFFTSESVTEGHPDKVADQMCDALLDAIIEKDPAARVACEATVKTGLVLITGEISTKCYVDMPRTVRNTLRRIGYTRAKYGFDADTCAVLTAIEEQSPDIALGVDRSMEAKAGQTGDEEMFGAGDQGMVFGYACDETPTLMPMPVYLAHQLSRRLAHVRHERILPFLRPDGKTQVTVEYEGDQPKRVDAVVISAQHRSEVGLSTIREGVMEEVVRAVIPTQLLDDDTRYFINPTGRFVVGGPQGDAGLSGRKIIVDTYGGYARHGGGSFSGKDPSKVDRSGTYFARYVAKNVVGAGLAKRCELQVAYIIGVANPVSLLVETFGTSVIPEEQLAEILMDTFDFRPSRIIRHLELRRPIYEKVACYGHFGRDDLDLPWEQLNKVDLLREKAGV